MSGPKSKKEEEKRKMGRGEKERERSRKKKRDRGFGVHQKGKKAVFLEQNTSNVEKFLVVGARTGFFWLFFSFPPPRKITMTQKYREFGSCGLKGLFERTERREGRAAKRLNGYSGTKR